MQTVHLFFIIIKLNHQLHGHFDCNGLYCVLIRYELEVRHHIIYFSGAGEDDFHNYDLEKLLKHAGAARNGLANGAAGAKDIEKEALLKHEEIPVEQAVPAVALRQKKARFEGANVESVDVARFITSRLAEANSEDAAYPRDTLLHYGYEGEGSDVDDLSELGDSEDESDDEDGDFGFLGEWGAKFDNLNKIFNPPTEEFDEDV